MVKFTARFRENLYGKIKAYADQEEITVMAAIRYILTQFFKDKK